MQKFPKPLEQELQESYSRRSFKVRPLDLPNSVSHSCWDSRANICFPKRMSREQRFLQSVMCIIYEFVWGLGRLLWLHFLETASTKLPEWPLKYQHSSRQCPTGGYAAVPHTQNRRNAANTQQGTTIRLVLDLTNDIRKLWTSVTSQVLWRASPIPFEQSRRKTREPHKVTLSSCRSYGLRSKLKIVTFQCRASKIIIYSASPSSLFTQTWI